MFQTSSQQIHPSCYVIDGELKMAVFGGIYSTKILRETSRAIHSRTFLKRFKESSSKKRPRKKDKQKQGS